MKLNHFWNMWNTSSALLILWCLQVILEAIMVHLCLWNKKNTKKVIKNIAKELQALIPYTEKLLSSWYAFNLSFTSTTTLKDLPYKYF